MTDPTNDAPRPAPGPRGARSSSDVDAVADVIEGAVTQARPGAPTIMHSVITSLLTAGLTAIGVGAGGLNASAKLEAKVDLVGSKLDAIATAAGRLEATQAAQRHEERLTKLEALVAEHELRIRLANGGK